MHLEEVRELIRIFEESKISEMELETEGFKIALKKSGSNAYNIQLARVPSAEAPTQRTVPELEEPNLNQVIITAPMVGTFYRASSPDAEPYVSLGDMLTVGQPICVIEAMKVMNEIESEVSGKVIQILVEDAQPVEYGQPLFVVEKNSISI
ncbi:MAG: acetyl-CoA carboxylase biotin carboxyl carrier protein [Limnochordia bacterium]|nr:acetyl-CoA carboxylase biotin carboxyl carrier protein [Limnochordia bacterium]